jgi:alpha-glucoside transport system substrate-binding protein
MSRKFSWVLSLLMITALLAACGGGAAPAAPEAPAAAVEPTEAPAAEPAAEATEAPAEEAAAEATEVPAEEAASDVRALELGDVPADTPLARALDGEFEGTVVTMFGPFTDEDAVKFNNSMVPFETATGIDIQYEGSKEFETTISVRVDAGDPPDIADFPQPGLLANLVRTGSVVDVSTFIPMEWLESNYNQSWLDMAMMEGPDGPIMAGVWQRFNGKSLVWYPKAAFDAAGYTVPTTWDEMMELSRLIADDGDTPWCIGIESGTATGWPATDWIEDIMLRTTSLENYDAWTRGDLAFASPEVQNAAETMAEIWQDDSLVYGGQASIVSTFFGDAPTPMFDDPPKCWLHRQGNFITSFFPTGTEAGVDYDFFYLPPIDEQYGRPFLVAGDIMAAFSDRPEVQAVMQYFTYGDSVRGWLAAGGALSPHMDASLDWYGDDVERGIAEIVQNSTSVRFDGSDLMPGEVGAGSFWKGMTDWIAGTVPLETALQEIDAAWPR